MGGRGTVYELYERDGNGKRRLYASADLEGIEAYVVEKTGGRRPDVFGLELGLPAFGGDTGGDDDGWW